ncbi:MAG: class I mannose-6-phosphate isomerase [Pleomorphochaeta sp.]
MSFMFNPFPYDDWSAVNVPNLSSGDEVNVFEGNFKVSNAIVNQIVEKEKSKGKCVVLISGYPTAVYNPLINLIGRNLYQKFGLYCDKINIEDTYKSSKEIEDYFSDILSNDPKKDPKNLYAKLSHDNEDVFFDKEKVEKLLLKLKSNDNSIIIIYGNFATTKQVREFADIIYYMDVIPKNVVLRYKRGEAKNIGDEATRNYGQTMRRAYYVDFEVSLKHKTELIDEKVIDWYIEASDSDNLKMISRDSFEKICDAVVKQPFRCKPVYCEGVWGGYSTLKLRNLPSTMKNCAWVFDLIPSEVSLVIKAGSTLLDIPFYTFIRMESIPLLGKKSVDTFGRYFPVRFNYDDTIHSSGSMSIQCHPDEAFIKENFNELGRQDESYYVVEAAMGSKTYLGFQEGSDPQEFIEKVKESEKDHTEIDYDKYVNSVPSVAGMQYLIPAGTIHSSGRNQVVLEIGSLTVGSYTFKMYDFLRKDLDGTPRPIHSYYGEKVLHQERKSNWVKENLVQEPKLVAQGKNWKEVIVGEHDLIYFSLRRLEFMDEIYQNTNDQFNVLALVDGEKVRVESVENSQYSFEMKYRDVIVLPACVGKYRIINLSNHPVAIHKTQLK